MPIEPGQWARDYYNNQSQRAAQEQSAAQRNLLGIFETEARRQLPWSDYPIDSAILNQRTDAARELIQRRHELTLERQRERSTYDDFKKVAATPPGKVAKLVKDTDKAFGFNDPAYGLTTVSLESSFDPMATSPAGAKGLVQFMDDTALRFGVTNPYDPVQSIAGEARLRAANIAELRANGIEPTPDNVYLAHQQGSTGAIRLLKNPNSRAGDVVGDDAIRGNKGDPNAPAISFTTAWSQRFMTVYNQYKAQLAEEAKTPSQQITIDQVEELIERQPASPDDVAPEDEDDLLSGTTINGKPY